MLVLAAQHAFGTVSRGRSTPNLHSKLVKFEPGLKFPIHTHECPGFYFLLQGQNRDVAPDGSAIDQLAGTRCYFNRDTPHARHIGPKGLLTLNISFEPSWLERLGLMYTADETNFWRVDRSETSLALLAFILGEGGEIEFESMALELLACFSRNPEPKAPKWLDRSRDFLRHNYRRPIGLQAVAEEVAIDPAHLSSTFRRFYGCTLTRHLQSLRVRHVIEGLASGEKSLGVLALEAGFADQAHMSRVFRSRAGLWPRDLKRILKSQPNQD